MCSLYKSIALVLVASVLAGCGLPGGTAADTASDAQPFIPVLAASELQVGPNRLPLGILRNGTPINDPQLRPQLRFYYLDGDDKATVQAEAEAIYRGQGLPIGLYVAYPTFDQAGAWAVEVQIPGEGGQAVASRLRLEVLPEARTPAVGTPAIASDSLTSSDNPDLKQISSDGAPDPDLYRLSIADALAAEKPFLVAFSTPGYCKTAVCGPNLQVIKQLKEQHQGQVNFIHVEVYPYPFGESAQLGRRVPAMEEWRLQSEPWTFLVDANGIIQAKYEGGITFAELEPALRQLAAGQQVQPVTS